MSAPIVIVNPPENPNLLNDSQEPAQQSANEQQAMQLGQVLESNRQTLTQQQELETRLQAMEARQADWGAQLSQISGQLQTLATPPMMEEEEEEVETVEAEPEPEQAPEPEPTKARATWHRILFG